MEYLIRFIQAHESFRQPETNALADLLGLKIEWLVYHEDVRKEREAKGGPCHSLLRTCEGWYA